MNHGLNRNKQPTLVCLINVQVLINVQGGKWVKIKKVQGQINVQGGKMLNLDNLVG